jgi:hypothetical protein
MFIYIGGVYWCNKDERDYQPVTSKNISRDHIHGRKKKWLLLHSWVNDPHSISDYPPELGYK